MPLKTEFENPRVRLAEYYGGQGGTGLSDYIMRNFNEGVDFTTAHFVKRDLMRMGEAAQIGTEKAFTPLEKDAYESSPFYREAIPYRPGMTELDARVNARIHDKRQLDEIMRGQYTGDHELAGALAGTLAGGLLGPENYIAPFGASKQVGTTVMRGIMRAGLEASVENAAISAGLAPFLSDTFAQEGRKYGAAEAVEDTMSAAGVGFLLGAGGRALGAVKDAGLRSMHERKVRLEITQRLHETLRDVSENGPQGAAERVSGDGLANYATEPVETPRTLSERLKANVSKMVDTVWSPGGRQKQQSGRSSEVFNPSWRKPLSTGEAAPTAPKATVLAQDADRVLADLETKMRDVAARVGTEDVDAGGLRETLDKTKEWVRQLRIQVMRTDETVLAIRREIGDMRLRLEYLLGGGTSGDMPAAAKPGNRVEKLKPEEIALKAEDLKSQIEAKEAALADLEVDAKQSKEVADKAERQAKPLMRTAGKVAREIERVRTFDAFGEPVMVDVKREADFNNRQANIRATVDQLGGWLGKNRFITYDPVHETFGITRNPKHLDPRMFLFDLSRPEHKDSLMRAMEQGKLDNAMLRDIIADHGLRKPEIAVVANAVHDEISQYGSCMLAWRPGDEHRAPDVFIVNKNLLDYHGYYSEAKLKERGYTLSGDLGGVMAAVEQGLITTPDIKHLWDRYSGEFTEAKNRYIRSVVDQIVTSSLDSRQVDAAHVKKLALFFGRSVAGTGKADPRIVSALTGAIDGVLKDAKPFTAAGEAIATRKGFVSEMKALQRQIDGEALRGMLDTIRRFHTNAEHGVDEQLVKAWARTIQEGQPRLFRGDMTIREVLAKGLEIGDGVTQAIERFTADENMVRELERMELRVMADRERVARALRDKRTRAVRAESVREIHQDLIRRDIERAMHRALEEIAMNARVAAQIMNGTYSGWDIRHAPELDQAFHDRRVRVMGEDGAAKARKLDERAARGEDVKDVATKNIYANADTAIADALYTVTHEGRLRQEEAMRAARDAVRVDYDPAMQDTIAGNGSMHFTVGKGSIGDANLGREELHARMADAQDRIAWHEDELWKIQSGEEPDGLVATERFKSGGRWLNAGTRVDEAFLSKLKDRPKTALASEWHQEGVARQEHALMFYGNQLATLGHTTPGNLRGEYHVSGDLPMPKVDPERVEARIAEMDKLTEKTKQDMRQPGTTIDVEGSPQVGASAHAVQRDREIAHATADAIKTVSSKGC